MGHKWPIFGGQPALLGRLGFWQILPAGKIWDPPQDFLRKSWDLGFGNFRFAKIAAALGGKASLFPGWNFLALRGQKIG